MGQLAKKLEHEFKRGGGSLRKSLGSLRVGQALVRTAHKCRACRSGGSFRIARFVDADAPHAAWEQQIPMHLLVKELDEEVDGFEIGQLVVVDIDAKREEQPSVTPIDDLVRAELDEVRVLGIAPHRKAVDFGLQPSLWRARRGLHCK